MLLKCKSDVEKVLFDYFLWFYSSDLMELYEGVEEELEEVLVPYEDVEEALEEELVPY